MSDICSFSFSRMQGTSRLHGINWFGFNNEGTMLVRSCCCRKPELCFEAQLLTMMLCSFVAHTLEPLLCRMAYGATIPLPWTLPQSCTVSGCWALML